MDYFWHWLTIAAALAGFFIANYIRRKKHRGEKLVCPLRSDCEAVVHSQYSTLLGIPLEYLGMTYYLIIAAAHGVFLVWPASSLVLFHKIILAATVAAFGFSMYLTFIQAFKLRQWCVWCLISASFCTVIFALTLTFL